MSKRGEQNLMRIPGSKQLWTALDCQVGGHRGVFPITRTPEGWACPQHGGKE